MSLFGPTDAKLELCNLLKGDLAFSKVKIETKSSERMSENQELAFVKAHFNHSTVPIIAIPYKYKSTTITNILYASDLVNFKKEIVKVVAFAKPLKAIVELLNLRSVLENKNSLEAIETAIKKIAGYPINFNVVVRNSNDSIVSDIEAAIKKQRPSLMIMFTEQNRSLFDRIFLSSKSAEYSFNAKVPLLVFQKS
ncbi:hypothetical protein H7X64_02785 [Armatimonadetes bacterium]|nr:hypothetical protein [bacterium]